MVSLPKEYIHISFSHGFSYHESIKISFPFPFQG